MALGMCALCKGYGNLWRYQGRYEWHTCPVCGGAGVRLLFSAPTINRQIEAPMAVRFRAAMEGK